MANKQSEYLKSLLAESPPPSDEIGGAPPSPAQTNTTDAVSNLRPPRGMTLLGRDTALARIATGEVRQVTQLLLDPARVRIWTGNARRQDGLSEESCRDLIDAILAEGGQKVPAIVRRVDGSAEFDYEVIAGTRRHWAISWLRSNSYPDMAFLAQVHSLDDESAFRIADIENRARKDVSDFERARNYRDALQSYYENRQNRMADRLRLSRGWLSKMLTVAALPDWAVAAFSSPSDIQLKACYPLAQRVVAITAKDTRDADAERAMMAVAKTIAKDQDARRRSGQSGLPAAQVAQLLLDAHKAPGSENLMFSCDSAHGRRALTVLSANRNGVTLRLHAGSGASEGELARLLKDALMALAARGQGLKL
jgi:ParB family chromosome partitioning protein